MRNKDQLNIIHELGNLWKEYNELSESTLIFPTKYQNWDPEAYDGEGAYYPGAEGFMNWVADGCPTDIK